MSWREFLAQWGLIFVGVVWGRVSARRKLEDSMRQTDRMRIHRDAAVRMLEKACQPKITILPAPERKKQGRFDWKAGVGVE